MRSTDRVGSPENTASKARVLTSTESATTPSKSRTTAFSALATLLAAFGDRGLERRQGARRLGRQRRLQLRQAVEQALAHVGVERADELLADARVELIRGYVVVALQRLV